MGKVFFLLLSQRTQDQTIRVCSPSHVENIADLEHSILMDRIMEKEKLLKLFQDIDYGAKTVSAKIQSSGKDVVYQISMGGIQGDSQKQPEYVLGLIEQIRADTPE